MAGVAGAAEEVTRGAAEEVTGGVAGGVAGVAGAAEEVTRGAAEEVTGGVAGLAALRRDGHVVIVFGCYSAPPCVRELPEINRLAAERPPGFRFVFIYTREIHPNEDLPHGRFPHHRSLDGKLAVARKLASDLSPDMTVAVDDLAGTVHLGYGGLPFCAAIVRRDGMLVHREEWASAGQLRAVIANLSQADRRLAARRAAAALPERDPVEHGAPGQEALILHRHLKCQLTRPVCGPRSAASLIGSLLTRPGDLVLVRRRPAVRGLLHQGARTAAVPAHGR